jgi:hypothetical protein
MKWEIENYPDGQNQSAASNNNRAEYAIDIYTDLDRTYAIDALKRFIREMRS